MNSLVSLGVILDIGLFRISLWIKVDFKILSLGM